MTKILLLLILTVSAFAQQVTETSCREFLLEENDEQLGACIDWELSPAALKLYKSKGCIKIDSISEITGTFFSGKTKKTVKNAKIIAIKNPNISTSILATTKTDKNGKFKIKIKFSKQVNTIFQGIHIIHPVFYEKSTLYSTDVRRYVGKDNLFLCK